jgi:hypothetical protein
MEAMGAAHHYGVGLKSSSARSKCWCTHHAATNVLPPVAARGRAVDHQGLPRDTLEIRRAIRPINAAYNVFIPPNCLADSRSRRIGVEERTLLPGDRDPAWMSARSPRRF